MTLERFVLYFCLAVLVAFVIRDAKAASNEHLDDHHYQFCWSYMKQLKGLYYEVKRDGIDAVLAKYPPEAEGVSRDYALRLGNEIEALQPSGAQTWIEAKWNACLANPEGVGK
jgi:hypothetical protein